MYHFLFWLKMTGTLLIFAVSTLQCLHESDSAAYGRMLAMNYIHIVAGVLEPGAGKWVLLTWNLAGLLLVHAVYGLVRNRKYHWGMVRGLFSGVVSAVAEGVAGRSCVS